MESSTRDSSERLKNLRFGPITRDRLLAYAAASFDDNPIHLDADFARSVGLDTIVVHGTLLLGIGSQALARWFPGWTVKRLAGAFVAPVFAATSITISGRLVDGHPMSGGQRIRLVIRRDDGEIALVGDAVVAAPNSTD